MRSVCKQDSGEIEICEHVDKELSDDLAYPENHGLDQIIIDRRDSSQVIYIIYSQSPDSQQGKVWERWPTQKYVGFSAEPGCLHESAIVGGIALSESSIV
jgi:hypothetical protein